jgi:hypothetical protein
MRWLALLLILGNGIYFLWLEMQVVPVDGTLSPQVIPGDVARLSILKLEKESVVFEAVVSGRLEDPVPAEKESVCWLLGPFKEEISVNQVKGRLMALEIDMPIRSEEVEFTRDYWVHLPPMASRADAVKLLRELQSKKIDTFLITEGELANGLSLGLFTQRERAEAVYERRREQGYAAEIKVVPRLHTQYWGLFREDAYGVFADELWLKVSQGNPKLERHKKVCNKIASLDEFD